MHSSDVYSYFNVGCLGGVLFMERLEERVM